MTTDATALALIEHAEQLTGEPPLTCQACDTDPGPAVVAAVARCCGYTLDLCHPCRASFEAALSAYPLYAHLLGQWDCKGCARGLVPSVDHYDFRGLQ